MNKSILIGRLTRDPEVRGEGDHKSARFTLAVDRGGKDAGADFISCVAFRKTADLIEQYISKGTRIGIEGHINTGSYTNKDGNKVYTTDVIVDRLEFLESKRDETARNEQAPSAAPTVTGSEDFMQVPDDLEGLPFS